MSSHREAPEISKDPVADSTDVYAFVSPDKPDTVTLIANYIPLQGPAGGPNFYEFGDDVLYEIHVDNNGDGQADISYQFRFTTEVLDPDTFLYNTGPIESLNSPNWNRRQTYDVTVSSGSSSRTIGHGLACPPCNIGPLSTPDYPALAAQAVHNLGGGITVFAGQRAEGFYVDLGSIFDLGDLRPFENLHAQYGLNVFSGPAPGVNATNHLNVHSISDPGADFLADQERPPDHRRVDHGEPPAGQGVGRRQRRERRQRAVPAGVAAGQPAGQRGADPAGQEGPVELAAAVGRQAVRQLRHPARPGGAAARPLPRRVSQPGRAGRREEAARRPGGHPADRHPSGIIPGFQNFTGPVLADMLRLNTSIPPTPASKQSIYGLLGGDAAGFPNGRRVTDDVVAIELRAIAGVTYALVDKSFTPDAAAGKLTDGLTPASVSAPYLGQFPYLGVPYSGFDNPS